MFDTMGPAAVSRSKLCRTMAAASIAGLCTNDLQAMSPPRPLQSDPTILPLTEGAGGALCIAFMLDGLPFRAIVDTGSPFLTVPFEADCRQQPKRHAFFGCAPSDALQASSMPASIELYGITEAEVQWRSGDLSGLSSGTQQDILVGTSSRELMEASGGVFAGLIANGDGVHPTLLEQLRPRVAGFVLDGPGMELRLHHHSMSGADNYRPPIFHNTDAISLVDLRLRGDPVDHYAATATQLRIDGLVVPLRRPLVAVFDTGLSGALLSNTLCDEAPADTSFERLRSARSIEVVLQTERGARQTIRASAARTPRLFSLRSQPVPCFPDQALEPAVVVLGQAFLRNAIFAVDLNERRALCVQRSR